MPTITIDGDDRIWVSWTSDSTTSTTADFVWDAWATDGTATTNGNDIVWNNWATTSATDYVVTTQRVVYKTPAECKEHERRLVPFDATKHKQGEQPFESCMSCVKCNYQKFVACGDLEECFYCQAHEAARLERIEKAQRLQEISERAEKTLAQHLTRAQKKSLKDNNHFKVRGGDSGKTYRLTRGIHHGGIDVVDRQGRVLEAHCSYIRDQGIPDGDAMLAMMYYIKYDEEAYRKKANIYPRRQPVAA